jgi:hypothetical protein
MKILFLISNFKNMIFKKLDFSHSFLVILIFVAMRERVWVKVRVNKNLAFSWHTPTTRLHLNYQIG